MAARDDSGKAAYMYTTAEARAGGFRCVATREYRSARGEGVPTGNASVVVFDADGNIRDMVRRTGYESASAACLAADTLDLFLRRSA